MKLLHLFIAPMMFCALAGTAHAQQFETVPDIDTPDGDSNRYVGEDRRFGEAVDSGRDAFDDYGIITNVRNLTLLRQSEVFTGQNLYRFLDTFTNNTDARIRTTVNFSGNLGSDSDTFELLSEDGLVVSCENETDSPCVGEIDAFNGTDPVIAHVFSNINYGLASIGSDDDEDLYNALFVIDLAPGQSASILNYAFLASEESGTSTADIGLAINRGRQLQANPFIGGLSAAQISQVINFDLTNGVSAVPEPATWAMMIMGFGAIGGSLRGTRRRRSGVAFTTA